MSINAISTLETFQEQVKNHPADWFAYCIAKAKAKPAKARYWSEASLDVTKVTSLPTHYMKSVAEAFGRFVANQGSVPAPPAPEAEAEAPPAIPAPPAQAPAGLLVHKQAARIERILRQGKSPFLYGAPGAGKSYLIEQMASRAGAPFLCLILNQDSTKGEILGFVSQATGTYFPSKFRELWENGGFILVDEVCLALGQILNLFNNALANGKLQFPCGSLVPRHPECFIAFADNSNGWGQDEKFSERNDAGAAFRDRMSYVAFEYDVRLEFEILRRKFGSASKAEGFHQAFLGLRRLVEAEGLPLFASPRAAFAVADTLLAGACWAEALEESLWQGLPRDTWQGVWTKFIQTCPPQVFANA